MHMYYHYSGQQPDIVMVVTYVRLMRSFIGLCAVVQISIPVARPVNGGNGYNMDLVQQLRTLNFMLG